MKPKVMFISAANNIHTVRWVNELSKYFEIHLVYCKNHKEGIHKINSNVKQHSLIFKAPIGYYMNVLQLKRIYKKIKPDLVNVHYASGYGTLVRCSKVKHVLLSAWGSDIYEFPKKSKINEKILKKNILSADKIASTSYAMKDELNRQMKKFKKEIYVTPFGIDINKFKKIKIERTDDNINICTIKALEKQYGIADLISSIKILKENLEKKREKQLANKIKLYIYGDGTERKNLEKLIIEQKLEDTVYLKGKIANDKVPTVLNNMDIACVTSIANESFGVSVIEAMACEVPVITTKADGFLEVMEDGKSGYLVDAGNTKEIAEKIEKLVKNENLRKEMGKEGRIIVTERYNLENNALRLKTIYEEMIRKI